MTKITVTEGKDAVEQFQRLLHNGMQQDDSTGAVYVLTRVDNRLTLQMVDVDDVASTPCEIVLIDGGNIHGDDWKALFHLQTCSLTFIVETEDLPTAAEPSAPLPTSADIFTTRLEPSEVGEAHSDMKVWKAGSFLRVAGGNGYIGSADAARVANHIRACMSVGDAPSTASDFFYQGGGRWSLPLITADGTNQSCVRSLERFGTAMDLSLGDALLTEPQAMHLARILDIFSVRAAIEEHDDMPTMAVQAADDGIGESIPW